MSIARNLLKGSAVRTLEALVAIAVGFFMLPYMVKHLGEDAYGLWVVVSGITSAFYIFDLGFASSITVFLTRFFTQKDHAAINRTLSTALVIYSVLGAGIMLATIVAAWWVPHWTDRQEVVDLARMLVLITGASLALEFPFKAFAGIAVAHYRYDLVSWSRLIFKLLATVATIWLIESGYGLVEVAWSGFVVSAASNWVFYFIARHLYREMKVAPSLACRDTFRSLLNFSLWTFAIDSTAIIKNRGDVLVIAALLSTHSLTVYYVGVRLVDYAVELLGKATNMTTPVFSRYHAEGNLEETRKKVVLFSRITCILAGLAVVGLVALGFPFIRVWMGPDFEAQAAWECMLWILVGKMVLFSLTPASNCLYVHGDHRYLAVVGLMEAVVSVGLTYALVRYGGYGIVGAAIGMTACYYVTRVVLMAWRLCVKIEMRLWDFYRPLLPLILYFLVLSMGLLELCRRLPAPDDYLTVVLAAALVLLIFGLGILLLLSSEERAMLARGLAPLRRRRAG